MIARSFRMLVLATLLALLGAGTSFSRLPIAEARPISAVPPPITNPFVTQSHVLTARISQSGLVAIAATTLATNGWNGDQIAAANVHVFDGTTEVPISMSGGNGATLAGTTIRFIGHANTSRSGRERVYWLTYDNQPGLRGALALAPGEPIGSDDDNIYTSLYASPNGDHWFSHEIQAGKRVSVPLSLPAPVAAGTRLQIGVVGQVKRDHSLMVSANGQSLGTVTWSDAHIPITGRPQPTTLTLTLSAPLPAGTINLELALTSSGLPTDAALIETVTLPDVRLPYSATPIVPIVSAHTPLDLGSGPAPGVPGAEYLIITHRAFRDALDPLVALKHAQGQQVAVVDVQTAYDAWSFGARDPEAIRSLIRTVATRWQPAPTAVLLVGAGTVRMRPQDSLTETTFIPPYLVDADPWLGEIPCDTCYTRLDGDDPLDDLLPDIPIGRLPVRTIEEARTVVTKTVTALTTPPAGAWQQQAIILSDNDREADGTPDKAGGFAQTAHTVRSLLPASWQTVVIHYAPDQPASSTTYPDGLTARCAFFQAFDGSRSDPRCPASSASEAGASLLSYIGHASPWQWATTTLDGDPPYLYTLYDANRLHNGSRLPILLSFSCLTGSFANPDLVTTDELLLLHEEGGIVASLSSAGLVVDAGHDALARGIIPTLISGGTLGAGHLAGLHNLIVGGEGTSLAYSYQLLGDPQMTLPQMRGSTIYLPMVRR